MREERSHLDNLELIKRIDSADIFSYLQRFDGQVAQALALSGQLGSEKWMGQMGALRQIVFSGMGGSAIGGDLVRDLLGPDLGVPLLVNRGYSLPFVDSKTLVVLCSYSGNTAETLSCFSEAREAGARILTITSGGQLLEASRRYATPVVLLPGGYPPRCAIGFTSILLLSLLARLQLAPDLDIARWGSWLEPRAHALGPGIPVRENSAKQLAERLQGCIVLIYGSQGRLGSVARRWAGQFAENGKQLAHFSVIPEMNHNELVGWRHPEQSLSRLAAVFLRDRDEHEEISRRFQLTADLVRERAGHCEEIWSSGSSWPERLWSLVLLGDFSSVYAGILNGEDPTPVEVIEEFKRHLKEESTGDVCG